jgi:hypothetical protein
MSTQEAKSSPEETSRRLREAIRQTAPGTALRLALDMIIAGHLGALICIGDTEHVLAAGDARSCGEAGARHRQDRSPSSRSGQAQHH